MFFLLIKKTPFFFECYIYDTVRARLFNPLLHRYFDALTTDSFCKHCGKKRNCSYRAISPAMFSTQSDNCIPFVHIFDIINLFAIELEDPKSSISDKRLIQYPHLSLFIFGVRIHQTFFRTFFDFFARFSCF